ncbi:MAG: NPCBM/NEW2 domain-containing protein [Planctomycetota bacterium]
MTAFILPLLFLLPGLWPAAGEVVLHTLDGRVLPIDSLALGERGEMRVTRSGAVELLQEGQVLFAEILDSEPVPPFEADVLIETVDGSELTGMLGEGDEDTVELETAGLGLLRLPIDLIRAASFGPAESRINPSLLRATGSEDVLFRKGPVEGDELPGTLVRLGIRGVTIDCELGEIQVDLEKVLGVAVAPIAGSPKPYQRRAELELKDGGLLIGDLIDLSTRMVRVRTVFAEELLIPLGRLTRVRFSSDRFVYLSDLDPSQVEQTPFIGNDDQFLFPWCRDRSVTGQPLSVGGRRYGKGLGLHSRCRLTYDLDGGYSLFQGLFGLADEVMQLEASGSVTLRVLVDQEVRFESPVIRSGDDPVQIPGIELAGAKTLTIEVGFADRGDVADRVALCDPILVRVVG